MTRASKAKTYARLGVREYWVVNAETLETIVHLEPGAEGYAKISTHCRQRNPRAARMPALTVSMGALQVG